MFHLSLKKFLLFLVPCILVMGAMFSLTSSAEARSGKQQHMLTAQEGAHSAGLVKDGNFEKPIVSGGFNEYTAPQNFGQWTVSAGSIDLVASSYWMPAHGNQSVDLNGSNAGTISQDLSTVPGTNYVLSFDLAGNIVCPPAVKQMQVMWGSTIVTTLSFDITGHSASNMGWKHHKYTVQATDADTVLSFVSLTPGECGPALDAVSVKA